MVSSAARSRLQELRETLLTLHKALLESERIGYEQAIGPIPSPGYFLKLVTTDPWFAWLRPLSQLIVALDEVLDAPEPPTGDTVAHLVQQVRNLLVASEEGDGFPRSYFEALQRDPDVVFAHAGVAARVRSGG
ncbi:MAG: hypothetical protein JNL10_20930 [Verrucomicrobiales bacterium]|nr:hypothetical protein [Verrucomicrobiales bacterium]